jgi:uncharacterized membrane protein
MNGTRGLVIAVIAALLVGFSLGLVGGIVFMRFAWPGRPHLVAFPHALPGGPGPRAQGPAGPPEGLGPGHLLTHLEATLDLTPEQRQAIRETLRQTHEQSVALHESTRVAIERVLTGKQLAEWRKMESLYQHDRRGGHGRGPAGEDRP